MHIMCNFFNFSVTFSWQKLVVNVTNAVAIKIIRFIDTYLANSSSIIYNDIAVFFLQICLVMSRYHLTQYQPRSWDSMYWKSNFH